MARDTQPTEITARTVKQLQGHNALAVRSTANNDIDIDVSAYPGNKALVVSNTTDQQATVALYAKAGNYSFAGIGATKTVNAGSGFAFADGDFPCLRSPIQKLTVRISFSVAPTTGSVSSYIEAGV